MLTYFFSFLCEFVQNYTTIALIRLKVSPVFFVSLFNCFGFICTVNGAFQKQLDFSGRLKIQDQKMRD